MMASTLRIGIDASGGDFGGNSVNCEMIEGAFAAAKAKGNLGIVLYSQGPIVGEKPTNLEIIQVGHSNTEISSALTDLQNGSINALVTARNSFILSARCRKMLLPGIRRPGLLGGFPVAQSERLGYMIDIGATSRVDDPKVFIGWAKWGSKFLRRYLHRDSIKIGLANISAEHAYKQLQSIHHELQNQPDLYGSYLGFAEPEDFIISGKVDLLLTDGYLGNHSLKITEASVKMSFMKASDRLQQYHNALQELETLANELLSYDAHLISPLVGVNGWVFRMHGKAKSRQVARAILMAAKTYPIGERIFSEPCV